MGIIPSPWVLLAAVGIWLGSILGGFWAGHHWAAIGYEAQIAHQEADAQKLLMAAQAKISAQEATTARLNDTLGAQHEADLQEISDTRSDFDRKLADGVRNAERRARGSCPVPPSTSPAGQPAPTPTGGDNGSVSTTVESLSQLRDAALKLQASVRECYAWAHAHGQE